MPYVQRDGAGAIVGLYANVQDWFPAEFLPADDAAVADFLAPPSGDLAASVAEEAPALELDRSASRLDALEARVAALEAKAR